MEIIIIENDDKIQIKNSIITFTVRQKTYSTPISGIDKIILSLNDIKSDGNDMSLSLRIGEKMIIIPSDYEEFEDLLLNKICISLPADMLALTQAMTCTESGEFIIYER